MSRPTAAAAAGRAAGGVLVVFGDDEDVEPAEGLGVGGEGAVGTGDEDAAKFFAVAGAHLNDVGVEGAGGAVGALDQVEAGSQIEVESTQWDGVEVGERFVLKTVDGVFRGPGGDQGGGACGVNQALRAQIVGVGVAGAFAGEDADAAAGAGALAGRFDDLLVNAQGDGCNRFKVEVGVIAAGRKGFPEAAFQQALGNSELFEKVPLVSGSVPRNWERRWEGGSNTHRTTKCTLFPETSRMGAGEALLT